MEGAEFFRMLRCDGVDDLACVVGAAVVDGDDLEVGVVLRQEGVEGGGDVGGFVAGGDDDGDGRRALWGLIVLRVEEIGDAGQAEGSGEGFTEPEKRDEPGGELKGEMDGMRQTVGVAPGVSGLKLALPIEAC